MLPPRVERDLLPPDDVVDDADGVKEDDELPDAVTVDEDALADESQLDIFGEKRCGS